MTFPCFVNFASAFRSEATPCISHITLDGKRTPCGRTGWATEEGWGPIPPDCIPCRKAWEKLPEAERLASRVA